MDSSQVSKLLGSKESWLISMDKSLMIEISFLSAMLGAGGESVLQRRILKTMPDTSASTLAFTPAGSLQKIAALSDSRLAKFCSKSAQGQLAACRELLGSVVQGRAPNVDKAVASGGFLMTACWGTTAATIRRRSRTLLFGRDACQAKYELVKSAAQLKQKGDFERGRAAPHLPVVLAPLAALGRRQVDDGVAWRREGFEECSAGEDGGLILR